MTKKIFELEWDEENLSEGWMNTGNLELCLYSKEHTRRDLVAVREITKFNPLKLLSRLWSKI